MLSIHLWTPATDKHHPQRENTFRQLTFKNILQTYREIWVHSLAVSRGMSWTESGIKRNGRSLNGRGGKSSEITCQNDYAVSHYEPPTL